MEKLFKKIKPEQINGNIFELIGREWMLITAGNTDHYNMMTASWGTAGVLWRKPVVMIFVRPQRYTREFIEKSAYFSISFFEERQRDLLNLCGTTSGRDLNKMNIEGMTPVGMPTGAVGFAEAKLVLECRKIYFDDIDPSFFQTFDIEKIYPNNDYHRFYIGEIIDCWEKKL